MATIFCSICFKNTVGVGIGWKLS